MDKYILGIDGGGTVTDIALATVKGEIINKIEAGPASLRNNGIEESIANIVEGVEKIIPEEGRPVSTFVGLPALQEEYSDKKEYIQKFLEGKIGGKVEIGSDQLVAYRSGTDKSKGVVVIAGTGGVVRGFDFENEKDFKTSGWGYLADEGSAFWAGIKAYRKITKSLDKRGEETLIKEMVFEKREIKDENQFNRLIYMNPLVELPKLSVYVDLAQREGDKVAEEILKEAAEEMIRGVKTVVKELDFESEKFALVLVGGMFKSKFLEKEIEKGVISFADKAEIIKPEKEPVFGAIKLAIESYDQ